MGLFKSLDFNWEVVTAQGRAVAQRHQLEIPAKKKMDFSIDELLTASSIRQTGLNITVFTVGGTAYLGRLRSGSIKFTTETDEGSGAADLWQFPFAVGTNYEVSGEIQIASSASFSQLIAAAGTAGLLVTVNISLAGSVFAAPMTLTTSGHKIMVGKVQYESITLKNRGLPTTVTGNPVLASIGLGTSVVTYNAATGGLTASGSALITDTNISFGDGVITSASHTFANQGTPTVT